MPKAPEKEIQVRFSPEFDTGYGKLLAEVEGERRRGIRNSSNSQLLRAIDRAIEQLSIEPAFGIHIPKNRIPKKYLKEYGINNLWKLNLPGAWRLLYTLDTGKLEIVAILLEYMDHGKYSGLFGYKKK